MTTKYTPGPLSVTTGTTKSREGCFMVEDAQGREIGFAWDWPEAEGNAKLWAASTELAEVLHRFVISIEAGNIVRPDFAIFQHARQALQKAGLMS